MVPGACRVLLFCIAALASASGAAAQDVFGNGDGHSGAFIAPPGNSSVNIYTSTTISPDVMTVTVTSSAGFVAGDLILIWRAYDTGPVPTSAAIDLGAWADTGRYELARIRPSAETASC